MLQTMVSLLDSDRTIHVQVHDGLADVAAGALSAEPVTIDELHAAMGRFVAPSVNDFFMRQAKEGLASRSTEGGHMIIDLSARLLVNNTAVPELPRLGRVQTCDQCVNLDAWLPYRVPDDWHMVVDANDWEPLARQRRTELAAVPLFDARRVLYGELAESLVQQWLAIRGKSDQATVDTQSWWLLTPRDDLGGRSPRELLLARRRFIEGDIQDQGEIWTMTGECPPGLSPHSHAYLHGGFGPHELILYHELTAMLLHECERRLVSDERVDEPAAIRHLEQWQQEWLHQPQEELYDQSPAALISRERSRLPAVVPQGHDDAHDDCPICRMMAENGQPMIWQLDNYMLDSRFATSLFDTYEEWDEAQKEWKQFSEDWGETGPAMPMASTAAGSPAAPAVAPSEDAEPRVWNCSFTNMAFFDGMPPSEAVGVMLFSIGGHLAELIQDLRADDDSDHLVSQLHIQFDELHVFLKERKELWMINSSIAGFLEALNDVTTRRQDLKAKCADLEDKLDFLVKRYAEQFGRDQEAAY